ncbi:MAG: T9SS type A sorting domain-containing protein [Bacteroidia bacterium]|nr:T9SS type A sorting domain-containing protein [Bacteroidia bacterium]
MKIRILFFLGILQYVTFAQTGPAGVGNSTSNVLWLKADLGTFSDAGVTPSTAGGSVQQWNDQSGNSKHAIQLTATNKPTFQTNIFNGLPSIRFDGIDDGILSAGLSTNSQLTTFITLNYITLPVSKSNPGILQGSPTGLGYSTTPGNKSIGMWVNRTNQRIWGRGIQTDNSLRNITQVTALAANTGYITTNRYDGTNINQYVNNSIACTITYNGTLNSWTDVAIGTQGTETWDGNISEVIIYNISLNDAQKNIVDNYLSSKYNITLSANDKYSGDTPANGDYDKRVAGVGQESSGSNTTFSASVTDGLGISVNSGLNNGDYILAGYSSDSNTPLTTDVTGMTGTNNARWSRIWYIDVTNTSTNINTNIEFDEIAGNISGLPLSAPVSNYVLLYRAGQTGAWTELTTASAISGNKIQFNNYNLTTDGYYTVGTRNYMQSPLPITLLYFTAELNNKQVNLKWATASELNNDFFTIEKSNNGIQFESLTTTKAKGNENELTIYNDVDMNPFDVITYYRLKQTDKDGSYTYSKIISVLNNHSISKVSILPNPNDGTFDIQLNSSNERNIFIEIKDLSGKLYFKEYAKIEENNNQITVDTKNKLSKGTYILSILFNDKEIHEKLIIK